MPCVDFSGRPAHRKQMLSTGSGAAFARCQKHKCVSCPTNFHLTFIKYSHDVSCFYFFSFLQPASRKQIKYYPQTRLRRTCSSTSTVCEQYFSFTVLWDVEPVQSLTSKTWIVLQYCITAVKSRPNIFTRVQNESPKAHSLKVILLRDYVLWVELTELSWLLKTLTSERRNFKCCFLINCFVFYYNLTQNTAEQPPQPGSCGVSEEPQEPAVSVSAPLLNPISLHGLTQVQPWILKDRSMVKAKNIV